MGAGRIFWHFAQVLPIVTAGAWAIACIVLLFTVPTEPPQQASLVSSSSPTSPSFYPGRRALASAEFRWRRDYMFTLWIGVALGFIFVAVGIFTYVTLGLCDKYVRTRTNRVDQWLRRRKIVIVITTVFRVLGAIVGIALGSYYASKKDSKLAAAVALGFVFAIACIIAIVFTWTRNIERPTQSKEAMDQHHAPPTQYGNGGYGVQNSQAYGSHRSEGYN